MLEIDHVPIIDMLCCTPNYASRDRRTHNNLFAKDETPEYKADGGCHHGSL